MRKYFFVFVVLCSQKVVAQIPRYNAALLDTLAAISNDTTPSKHFAQLYYKAIQITNSYAHTQPQHVKQFIFGFEEKFGPLFFKAHHNFIANKSIPQTWQVYYSSNNYTPLQYQFLGMNAHVNGDMWKALVNAYTADTLQYYKKDLLRFQKAFNTFFDSIYSTTKQYKKVRTIHVLTLGLDKPLGRKMVYKWRKLQVNLAIWYTTKPNKFKRKLKRLQSKIKRWNKFAIRWLK
jgi:hypothetical protein